mmetsp:Transcript_61420/g.173202  ORF Transcript_61420/g.173202 Transcript_61420/m.173202 type:complete len:322 (-) Transcript_61420:156-1121(-)
MCPCSSSNQSHPNCTAVWRRQHASRSLSLWTELAEFTMEFIRVVAPAGIEADAAPYQRDERRRHGLGHVRRSPLDQDPRGELRHGAAVGIRKGAAEELQEDAAEGPDVEGEGALRPGRAEQDLGRDVEGRAHKTRLAVLGLPAARGVFELDLLVFRHDHCGVEIHELEVAVDGEEQVLGLEVAVCDAFQSEVHKDDDDLGGVELGEVQLTNTHACDLGGQLPTFHVLEHEIQGMLVLEGELQMYDPWMFQAREHPLFVQDRVSAALCLDLSFFDCLHRIFVTSAHVLGVKNAGERTFTQKAAEVEVLTLRTCQCPSWTAAH